MTIPGFRSCLLASVRVVAHRFSAPAGLLLVALVAAACGGTTDNGAVAPEGVDGPKNAPPAQLANPASTHCEQKGGRLEMRENADGQYGVCYFEDGTYCEEWAYFRGECAPGEPDRNVESKAEEP